MFTTLNAATQPKAELHHHVRVPSLDGLRGVAILSVISFHYVNNQLLHSENQIAKALCFVTSFGWVGVDLFFVLSGFLIGNIIFVNRRSANFFKVFYLRRFLRIVPAYYLLLVTVYIIHMLPAFAGNYFLNGNLSIPGWSYVLMIQNILMAEEANLRNSALSVTWSISIEEQFYLLFPLLLYYVRPKYIPNILLLVIVSASLFRMQFDHWIPPYVLLPARMDSIAFGLLLAFAKNTIDLPQYVNRYSSWILTTMVFLISTMGVFYVLYGDLGPIKHSIFALVFALLVALALGDSDSALNRGLRNRSLMWIGSISYSLYLFHYLTLGVMHHLFGNTNGIGISGAVDVLISAAALLISFFIAWILYIRFESPLVSYGRRLTYSAA